MTLTKNGELFSDALWSGKDHDRTAGHTASVLRTVLQRRPKGERWIVSVSSEAPEGPE